MKDFDIVLFRKRVWDLIHSKGLTMMQIAQEIGIKYSIIGKTLKWDVNYIPSVVVVYRLAQYFDVTTDYLLGIEPSKAVLDGEIAKFLDKRENSHIRESLAAILYKSRKCRR